MNAPSRAADVVSASLVQVAFDLRTTAVAFSDAANVMRAGMRQTWTMDDLLAHFHGFDRAQLLALLAEHCGVAFAKGDRQVVHLDHVLVLTAIIRKALVG